MVSVYELIATILSILVLITIGFASKRFGLLGKDNVNTINLIIVYLTMPALIFQAVLEAQITYSLIVIPALALMVMTACTAIVFLLGRRLNLAHPTFGALLLASAIGNTGYLGYPLTIELFGFENLVKAVFYDLFGTVLFMFTVGLFIAEGFGAGEGKINKLKEIVTFPPLIGLFAALLLRGVDLPDFILVAVGYLAAATVPLIMLSIGLSLELGDVKNYKALIAIACFSKLLLSPTLALLGGRLLLLEGDMLSISVLEASMPTVMFSLVIGLKYKLDTAFLPAVIVTTTMVSLITIPLWQFLLLFL